MPRRWLHSAPFDLTLFAGPALVAALAALALPGRGLDETPVWAWLLLVVGVDVSHVYASLYRVYFDAAEFSRRRSLYVNVPVACWGLGVLLYRHSPLTFWRVLAYVAVFHFVRQQYGFMRLYQRLEGRPSRFDELLDAGAVYAAMLYPLAFWHADPGRRFAWFVEGDFLRLPALPGAAALYAAILALFAARQLERYRGGEGLNVGKIGIVASTAAAWYVGIIRLNSDLAFTLTNVLAHGIPYLALVWLHGRRRWEGAGSWLGLAHRPAALGLFLLPLLGLAYLEEGLWDFFVWREHAAVFAGLWSDGGEALGEGALSLLVPLLAVPQAAHYVLDAWIWRLDGSNPGLRERLLGDRPPVVDAGRRFRENQARAETPA